MRGRKLILRTVIILVHLLLQAVGQWVFCDYDHFLWIFFLGRRSVPGRDLLCMEKVLWTPPSNCL